MLSLGDRERDGDCEAVGVSVTDFVSRGVLDTTAVGATASIL
jgi:hypothetical protein